eukprot:4150589-Pyramimonas_sp.AAC.1
MSASSGASRVPCARAAQAAFAVPCLVTSPRLGTKENLQWSPKHANERSEAKGKWKARRRPQAAKTEA